MGCYYSRNSDYFLPSDSNNDLRIAPHLKLRKNWEDVFTQYINWTGNYKEIYRNNKEFILDVLLRGPPAHLRWRLWKCVLTLSPRISLKDRTHANIEQQIENDIDRTFPESLYFDEESTKDSLRIALISYADSEPTIGYCQGMAFVVGILLLASEGNAEEAFLAFKSLSRDYGAKDLFKEGFPLQYEMCRIFHDTLANILPRIEENLQMVEIDDAYWLTKWFLTFFSYHFKHMKDILRVFDCIIANGVHFMVQFAIAIVKKFKNKFMIRDLEGMMQNLDLIKNSDLNIEELIDQSLKISLVKNIRQC